MCVNGCFKSDQAEPSTSSICPHCCVKRRFPNSNCFREITVDLPRKYPLLYEMWCKFTSIRVSNTIKYQHVINHMPDIRA